jgi:hypothetical protein
MTPLRMILIAGLIAAPILLLQGRYSTIPSGATRREQRICHGRIALPCWRLRPLMPAVSDAHIPINTAKLANPSFRRCVYSARRRSRAA